MSFRVTARTLIQLGAELISSDEVAIFELVKNAFDAGSPKVTIEFVIRMPHLKVRQFQKHLYQLESDTKGFSGRNFVGLKESILSEIDRTAPNWEPLSYSVEQSPSAKELLVVLEECNLLRIKDTGEGMSLETLDDVFLTVGTRSRQAARTHKSMDLRKRPILGEKGVGRLSSMRLGSRLRVKTSTAGEPMWNLLDIDWSVFSHDSDALLESFAIEPKVGPPKDDPNFSGTCLVISNLSSSWYKNKLKNLARTEFAKLTDPFTNQSLFPIQLLFNQENVPIPRFNRLILEEAQATVKARLSVDEDSVIGLAGKVVYYKDRENPSYKRRENAFSIEDTGLASITGEIPQVLKSLGPFDLEVYWFNRRILRALDGIGERKIVLDLVKAWSGGIMVFRDGFRVLPYGRPDDDWLDLDRKALASSGYKINRAQIIGRLNISNYANPKLTDQTNREGLRDCDEKRALAAVLKHVLEVRLRSFLNEVDGEISAREPINIEELDQRVEEEELQIQSSFKKLLERVPETRKEKGLINEIDKSVESLRVLMTDVRDLASSYEAGRLQLLYLAGIGLTVEILAHELHRAIQHVLWTLTNVPAEENQGPISATLNLLETQLKTLQKRLSVLDPLSITGRQRKETFDVVSLVENIIEDNKERFFREQITCSLVVEPSGKGRHLKIKAVKGMLIQILGNLIDNSVYWLRQQKLLFPEIKSEMTISIGVETRQLSVTDNGPGIGQDLKEQVFDAFYTTKPPGQGKGLGLFIGREIAKYHGADLYLKEPPPGKEGTCNTFVFSLEGISQ